MPKGWTDYLDTHLINPAKAAFGDVPVEVTGNELVTSSSSSEDPDRELKEDLASSVIAIGFHGKFPSGLTIKGQEIAKQQPWTRDFTFISPDNWQVEYPHIAIPKIGVNYTVNLLGEFGKGSQQKSEYGFMEEHADANDPKTSIINYCIPVVNMPDSDGRPTQQVIIIFKMPKEKAKRLIMEVKDRPNGASFAEDFLATTAPGIFADKIDGYGIRRDKMTSLWVIDEETQRSYIGDQILQGYFNRLTPENSDVANQAKAKIQEMKDGKNPFVLKQLSTPIQGVSANH